MSPTIDDTSLSRYSQFTHQGRSIKGSVKRNRKYTLNSLSFQSNII